jgi:hypothetical protein
MNIIMYFLIALAVFSSNVAYWGFPRIFKKAMHIYDHVVSLCYRYIILTCILLVSVTVLLLSRNDIHTHHIVIENAPNTDSVFFLCMISICSILPITCLFLADKYKNDEFGNVFYWYKILDIVIFTILLYYQII